MNEYRVKVSVSNNLIMSAIEKAGYKSLAAFCRGTGFSFRGLRALVALKEPPIGRRGSFTPTATQLMEELCLSPTDLWTEEQLTLELKRNTTCVAIDAHGVRAALGIGMGAAGGVDTTLSLEDIVFRKELVDQVEAALEAISPRRQSVLRLRFGLGGVEEHTLDEIGDKIDLTKERVRQIEASALRKAGAQLTTLHKSSYE